MYCVFGALIRTAHAVFLESAAVPISLFVAFYFLPGTANSKFRKTIASETLSRALVLFNCHPISYHNNVMSTFSTPHKHSILSHFLQSRYGCDSTTSRLTCARCKTPDRFCHFSYLYIHLLHVYAITFTVLLIIVMRAHVSGTDEPCTLQLDSCFIGTKHSLFQSTCQEPVLTQTSGCSQSTYSPALANCPVKLSFSVPQFTLQLVSFQGCTDRGDQETCRPKDEKPGRYRIETRFGFGQ